MNDWKAKMALAMNMMEEACHENEEWTKCDSCPFDTYCTALMNAALIDPFEGVKWQA